MRPNREYCHRCGEVLLAERSAYFRNRILFVCHMCHLLHEMRDLENSQEAEEFHLSYYKGLWPPKLRSTAELLKTRTARAARYMV